MKLKSEEADGSFAQIIAGSDTFSSAAVRPVASEHQTRWHVFGSINHHGNANYFEALWWIWVWPPALYFPNSLVCCVCVRACVLSLIRYLVASHYLPELVRLMLSVGKFLIPHPNRSAVMKRSFIVSFIWQRPGAGTEEQHHKEVLCFSFWFITGKVM